MSSNMIANVIARRVAAVCRSTSTNTRFTKTTSTTIPTRYIFGRNMRTIVTAVKENRSNNRATMATTTTMMFNNNKTTSTTTKRCFSTDGPSESEKLLQFHTITDETLEVLSDAFNDIMDNHTEGESFDVLFGDGVLTFNVGDHGIYVINKQTPNQQIWLSSPTSGPKRYTFDESSQQWVYAHDDTPLHSRLSTELTAALGEDHVFEVPE